MEADHRIPGHPYRFAKPSLEESLLGHQETALPDEGPPGEHVRREKPEREVDDERTE
jgi:hypothetical protein